MKLLRTIRLDPSDTFIFEKAAEPGEWAVPGSFVFWNEDPSRFEGKARTAFRGGLLGIGSLGWSTLAQVVAANEDDCAQAVEMLAQRLVDHFGAPDRTVARNAAAEEIGYTATLCDHPLDTLIAVHRVYEDNAIRETFRTLRPRNGPKPLRAFSFLEAEGDDEPVEEIDLSTLARERKGVAE
jgi:Family of unknown function (DUF6505)